MARILVVDDDADARDTISKFLEKSGHEVLIAANGRQALAEVFAQVPDVVLLDLLMPEMDGPTFLEVVRSYLRIQFLPVVVYTGVPGTDLEDRVCAQQVKSILVKGRATSDDVLKALEQAIVA